MQANDLINGLFEGVGAVVTWANVCRLRRDKSIRGVCISVQVFFTAWGLWNLWYYPSLGQWASFIGGVGLVCGNIAWSLMAFKYRKN